MRCDSVCQCLAWRMMRLGLAAVCGRVQHTVLRVSSHAWTSDREVHMPDTILSNVYIKLGVALGALRDATELLGQLGAAHDLAPPFETLVDAQQYVQHAIGSTMEAREEIRGLLGPQEGETP
jgi:hypothetical protein